MDTSYSTLTILQNLNLACNPVIKRDIPIKELTIINYARVSMDEYFIIIRGNNKASTSPAGCMWTQIELRI